MDGQIALLLGQDGIVNGAVYALMALALVLVFSVTRVIFIPQGEFVAFGALTMATLQAGRVPGTLWLLLALASATLIVEAVRHQRGVAVDWKSSVVWAIVLPALAALLVLVLRPTSMYGQAGMSLLLITPLGPLLYRLAFRPLAHATVLTLLIVSVALHGVLVGLGLYFFGAEGSRTTAFSNARIEIGALAVTGQSIVIVGVSITLILALYLYFERTLLGKALRATAVNRLGARLVGIGTTQAGRLAFVLAAAMGALCGVLIAPLTTVYYDSGFLIGLKGFVAAIIGGMSSYPIAAIGAVLVGLLESYSSFWASAFKEVIVFTLIIPVLLWRSLTSHEIEE